MKRQFQAFNYKVVNQADDTLDVYIDGVIVDAETQQILKDWFGDETSVSYKSFRDQVTAANPKKLNIYIISGGGIVTDAMAMHDFIKDQIKNGVTVNTIGRGIIASAATYILMAGGDNSSMSENSWFMIHNVAGMVWGDVNIIENYAKSMRKFNNAISGFYARATGLSETVIGNMMDAETWMLANEAKEKGFVKNIDGAAEFKNSIKPEQWPYSNTAVLNAYNSAVKVPSTSESDRKSFFSDIKNEFMNLFNDLKGAIKSGKEDKKFDKVENRDAILDMVEQVLGPVVNKIDQMLAVQNESEETEEKKEEGSTETKPAETKPAETKPVETKAEETKPAEEKEEDTKEENEDLKNLTARLDKMEAENKKLRAALANKQTLPEVDSEDNASDLSNIKVTYAR
jgi:ATP-dependent protease ClpP protease subunit